MDYVADGDLEDSDSELPLAHCAAANGETESLMSAIKADPSVLQQQDAEGLTPLSHATMAEQLDSLKLLVKVGASINTQDNLGRTCLAMAAYQGWYEGVVFLLRNGAKDKICDKAGRLPLHSATYCKDTRVLSALLQRLSPDDVNLQDNEGMGSLHWACFHNRPEHTVLLLEKGTNAFAHDIDGKTPLQWAAQKGSVECCRHLLQTSQGAGLVNMADYSGKTPLHFAAAAGHADVIRELAAHHPLDVDCEDPDERTPVHWAAAMGQSQALEALFELNANPSTLDLEQGSPLAYARQSGNEECVQIIEERLDRQGESYPKTYPDKEGKGKSVEIKNKKGPLGFIVDFFKTKKNKNVPNECSDEAEIPYNETSGGSDEAQNENNIHAAVLNSNSLSPEHQSKEGSEHNGSDQIISMKKLQLSRGDHPKMAHGKLNHYELGDIQPSHSQNVPLRGTKGVLPSNVINTDLDHSHLIRSPPPILKKNSPSMKLWNREKDHGKLEEDAAAILALQRSAASGSPQRFKQRTMPTSLMMPLSLQPIGRGTEQPLEGPDTLTKRRSYTVTPSMRMISNRSPCGDSSLSSKSQPTQLAPLRGPVPNQIPHLATNPVLEKVRKDMESEMLSARRTPTPTPFIHPISRQTDILSPNVSSPGDEPISLDGSASTPKRKKKKKKKARSFDMMEAAGSASISRPRELGDPYLDTGVSRHGQNKRELATSCHSPSSPTNALLSSTTDGQ